MYHIELRKFPNSACAFNLSETELRAIVEPWSRDRWVEVGERKWSPYDARLTVLEGPHLAVEDLAMGRGWGNAQRHGEDVTERVLVRARAGWDGVPATAGAATTAPAASAPAADPTARVSALDSAELSGLLGKDPDALLAAWRLAAARRPELPPSQSLALAEQTLSALDAEG